MNIILQNQHGDRQRQPTRQPRQGKSYRISIDDLLTYDKHLDTGMARWCQHRLDDGAMLFLWSSQGETARQE